MNAPLTIGMAFCGSFCTHKAAIDACRLLVKHYRIIPIFSESVQTTDTRFGKADDFCQIIETICGEHAITTVTAAERIGPEKLFDLLVIAPCTGNTLAKIAAGIIDGTVPMAANAHLRNARPLLFAIASNDALSAGLHNIATLVTRKHCYFVPFGQDDPVKKPTSLVADLTKLPAAIEEALKGQQLQPLLLRGAP